MASSHWKILAVVLALGTVFRLWGAFDDAIYVGDEALLVPTAASVTQFGTSTEWHQPRLISYLVAATIAVFGDGAVGWRIGGILLGAGTILLLYLLGRQLYPDSSVPLVAATLLALDPFHVHYSRTVMMEIPATFFFLLFLYLLLEHAEHGRRTLTLAGVALGLTVATKAYFVLAIPAAVGWVLYRARRRGRTDWRPWIAELAVNLLLLPVAVYLLSYVQWFGRGYSLTEFLQFKYDGYWAINHAPAFTYEEILAQGGREREWFVRPLSFGHHLAGDATHGRYSIEINNPIFRLMVLPALGVAVVHAWKDRLEGLLAPLLFTATYALFFLVSRPFNSYSALALLPFAWLVLADAVVILARRWDRERRVVAVFLGVVFVSGCYLYPISAGLLVPTALYGPLLSVTHLTKVF